MEKLEEMLYQLEKEYEKAHKELIHETQYNISLGGEYLDYVETVLVLAAKIEALNDLQELLEEDK